ncbi:unnamed protein product [Oppiella nova]|uniref:Uncharacterized protein n=1 Tax=Oppiella nova TaxID=334625 RepID=A0A7R9QGQ0_9ACAR|nr:unnamed protein product [Oppiella nova]CAG2165524.1 unnamed protein product [Oppiella nova]
MKQFLVLCILIAFYMIPDISEANNYELESRINSLRENSFSELYEKYIRRKRDTNCGDSDDDEDTDHKKKCNGKKGGGGGGHTNNISFNVNVKNH